MPRDIAFLVFPEFQILDLTGPLAAFEMPTRTVTPTRYRLHVLSKLGGTIKSSSGLAVATERIGSRWFDTLIVAGGLGVQSLEEVVWIEIKEERIFLPAGTDELKRG